MKAAIIALMLGVVALTGCARSKVIDGKLYQPYGFANQNTIKDTNVVYSVPVSNFVVGVLFGETIIVPGYILGWDLFEPQAVTSESKKKESK